MQHLGRKTMLDLSSAFNAAKEPKGDLDAVVFCADVLVEQRTARVVLDDLPTRFQTRALFGVMLLQKFTHHELHGAVGGSPVRLIGERHACFVPHEIVFSC